VADGDEGLGPLADTSAWTTRRRDPEVSRAFGELIEQGFIATCGPVKLEILRTARDANEFAAIREELDALTDVPTGEDVWRRALDVFEALARRGPLHHRQVALPDLVIAAATEVAGLELLHYDRHFELIAEITGQPVRALAPLGSL